MAVLINKGALEGFYRDHLWRGETCLEDSGWQRNKVVDRCRELLAAFMRGERVFGIRAMAVGRGSEEWDVTPPRPPRADDRSLLDRRPSFLKIQPEAIRYLTPDGRVSRTPTPRLEIRLELEPGFPRTAGDETYPLREFGLFGRVGNEDYMIDYVRHPVIHKKPADRIVRRIRLIF